MSNDSHTCATCGALVENDWSSEHSDFHEEVRDLRAELVELRQFVNRILVGDD